MPTAGDFSLHVIGQAQGFEQMGSQINQLATTIDTTGSSIQRFGSTTSSLSSGFSSVTTGVGQMTAGFTQSNDALSQFGQSTTTFSSTLNTMGSGFTTAGQSVTQFGQGLQQGQASVGEFTSGIGQLNTAVGQSAGPLNQFSQSVSTLESDLSGVGQGVQGVQNSLQGLAQGGLTPANTMAQGLGETFEMNTGIFQNFDNTQKSTFDTMKSGFKDTQQLAAGFSQAAGSITGLVFSAYALEKAQFSVHKIETTLEATRLKLEKQTSKLADIQAKYGEDSEEVARALEGIELTEQRLADTQERAGLVQENYTHQLTAFAATTGPLVVSTISGISQGVQSMTAVFGISEESVSNFIGKFGGLIGIAGTAIVVFADLVSMLATFQKAMEDADRATKMGDLEGAATARGRGFTAVQDDPLNQISRFLSPAIPGSLLDIGRKQIEAEAEFFKQREAFKQQLRESQASTDWASILAMPPAVTTEIKAKQLELAQLLDPANISINTGVTQTGAIDAAYVKTWHDRIVGLNADILADAQALTAERNRVMMDPKNNVETAMWIGVPDNATLTQSMAQYKAYQNEVNVAYSNFRNAQKMGYQGSVDDYTREFLGGMNEQEKAMLKQTVTNADDLIKETEKANEAKLKSMIDAEKDKAKIAHEAIIAEKARRVEEKKALDEEAKQAGEVEKQRVEAWNMRRGLIKEEADMTKTLEVGESGLVEVYKKEALAYSGLNSLTGLRNDQIALLALNEEKHEAAVRKSNDSLLAMADSVGIMPSLYIQWKASEDDTIGAIEEENINLRELINTHIDLEKIMDGSRESLDKELDAYTAGIVGVQKFTEASRLKALAQQGETDALVKLMDKNNLWVGNMELTVEQMKKLEDEFLATGDAAKAQADIMNDYLAPAFAQFNGAIMADKLKDLKKELKDMPGFKDFSKGVRKDMLDVAEDLNKVQKKAQEFKTDVETLILGAAKGLGGKELHSILKTTKEDIDAIAKVDPDAGAMKQVTDYLGTLTGTQLREGIQVTGPALRAFYAALLDKDTPGDITPEEMKAIIKEFPEIFKAAGVAAGGAAGGLGELAAKVAELGDSAKTTEEKYLALNKTISESKDLRVVLPQYAGDQPVFDRTKGGQKGSTGDVIEGKDGDKKTGDDFGLKAMEAADKMAVKLNQDLNKYVIAGMNLVGNKSSELLKVMGGNFDKLESSVNQSQISMNKVMNTHMINGMNLTGNKSAQLNKVMGGEFDKLESSVNSSSQSMNKVMNSHLIAGMNLTGNKSAQLDTVMSHNFADMNKNVTSEASKFSSTMSKMVTAMKAAESEAKALVSQLGKIKDVKATVTTHFEITGSASAQAAAGVHNATGGIHYANKSTTAIYGEAGPELALFLPIRQAGETRKGNFDITVPSPVVDLSSIRNAVNNVAQPRNSKDLVGDAGRTASRAVTIVLNTAEKVMLNERELIEVIRQKVFKHVVQEMG